MTEEKQKRPTAAELREMPDEEAEAVLEVWRTEEVTAAKASAEEALKDAGPEPYAQRRIERAYAETERKRAEEQA